MRRLRSDPKYYVVTKIGNITLWCPDVKRRVGGRPLPDECRQVFHDRRGKKKKSVYSKNCQVSDEEIAFADLANRIFIENVFSGKFFFMENLESRVDVNCLISEYEVQRAKSRPIVISGCVDYGIEVWNYKKLECLHCFGEGFDLTCYDMCFTDPLGNVFAGSFRDFCGRLYDLGRPDYCAKIYVCNAYQSSVSQCYATASNFENFFLSCHKERTVCTFDLRASAYPINRINVFGDGMSMCSPVGERKLFVGDDNGYISCFDLRFVKNVEKVDYRGDYNLDRQLYGGFGGLQSPPQCLWRKRIGHSKEEAVERIQNDLSDPRRVFCCSGRAIKFLRKSDGKEELELLENGMVRNAFMFVQETIPYSESDLFERVEFVLEMLGNAEEHSNFCPLEIRFGYSRTIVVSRCLILM